MPQTEDRLDCPVAALFAVTFVGKLDQDRDELAVC